MKGYNRIKNAMIAVLSASIYYNACMTCANDTAAVVVGTISMFGCLYCLMNEADKLNTKAAKKIREMERGM